MDEVGEKILEHLAPFFKFGANNIGVAVQDLKSLLVLFSLLAYNI